MNRPRNLALSVFLLLTSAVVADDKEKIFGPEWTKDGEYYRKKKEIDVSHPVVPKNGVTAYKIDLEKSKLWANESDDGSFCTAAVILSKKLGSMSIEVSRDKKGEVYLLKSVSNRVIYYDFDQDGIFDAYIDSRGKDTKKMILVGDTFIRVENSKDAFRYPPEEKGPYPHTSYDGKTRYQFKDGKWLEMP